MTLTTRLLISTILTSLTQTTFAAPKQQSIDAFIECEQLLRQHVRTATNVRPWSELPEALAHNVKGATIFIRLPVDLSGNETIGALSRLVETRRGLTVLEPLKIIEGFGLFTVARGSKESLLDLHERLKGTRPQFQIFTYNSLRDLSLPFPDHIYRSSGDVAALIAREGEPFLALHQGQLLFFIPRTTLAPLLDAEIMKENRVSSFHLRVPPLNWVRWIEEKGDFFKGKGIVLSSYWAVVSAGAYQVLLDMEAELKFRHSPQVTNVEAKLLEQLEKCFALVCGVTPPKPESETLSYANRRLILDFLREHRKSVALSEPYGVRHAFMALADLIENPLQKSQYKNAIKGIAYVPTEYVSVAGEDNATNVAVERMITAWRAFLRAKKLPQADLPLTEENIQAAIEASTRTQFKPLR